MKKLSSFLICLILLFMAAIPAYADTPPFDVAAKAVYLYNLDTKTLVYEKNADEPIYPASVTKIMTCILALEQTQDLDAEKAVFPNYVQDYLYTYQKEHGAISLGGLLAGEELSMRQLLYALMLPSANEAAMIIADHIGGSQEGFVEMMNKRAKELGATSTNFVNPNGLFDERHVTTARDIARLTQHAMELDGFMEIVSTTSYESGATNKHDNLTWNTTNHMMLANSSYFYPTLKGIKTGTLPQSGRCFVSTATRDGFTYLSVVMGAPYTNSDGTVREDNTAFELTAKLYDWVFDNYRVKALMEKGRRITEIPLRLSMDQDYLPLMTGDRFTALVNKSIDAASVTPAPDIPDWVDAPIQKGDQVGEVKLLLSGEEIGSVPLLAAETVEASPFLVTIDKIKKITKSFWFKFILVFFVLLIILYIILMILRNRNRRRYGGYRPRRRL